jgi:hypothetical protein
MSQHFSNLAKFKSRIGSAEFDIKQGTTDKEMALSFALHLSDISNPCKNFDICRQWTELLYNGEFFMQGDRERAANSPISYLMDRATVNIANAQLGFIDVIIIPAFEALSQMIPEVKWMAENAKANKTKWIALEEEYNERREAEKKRVPRKSLPGDGNTITT